MGVKVGISVPSAFRTKTNLYFKVINLLFIFCIEYSRLFISGFSLSEAVKAIKISTCLSPCRLEWHHCSLSAQGIARDPRVQRFPVAGRTALYHVTCFGSSYSSIAWRQYHSLIYKHASLSAKEHRLLSRVNRLKFNGAKCKRILCYFLYSYR